jgi:fructokinase
VPEILHAEPLGFEDIPPFVLTRYVDGVSFLDLKRAGDREAIAQAAFSAGETLARIGGFKFPKPGWLAPGPTVTAPLLEGADPMPRFVDLCMASPNFEPRAPAELRDRIHALLWSWAGPCGHLMEETRLVHGDFNRRNLLVRSVEGRWSVVVVLDWEFAISGSPLADCGNFLRYERMFSPSAEHDFSSGFLTGGGALPSDWRRLARLVDLTAVCESLTHDPLTETLVEELIGILRGAVEDLERSP